jgi:aspartate racemase
MKTIGLLGVMGMESTIRYVQDLNSIYDKMNLADGWPVAGRSSKIVMRTIDFEDIANLRHDGKWDNLGDIIVRESKIIEKMGAEFLVMTINAMHKFTDRIQSEIKIPLLNIADATAKTVKKDGFEDVALIGTKFIMEQDFYKGRLQKAGLNILVPDEKGRDIVQDIIYSELCQGMVSQSSYFDIRGVLYPLNMLGAKAVILGCTELGMLIRGEKCKTLMNQSPANCMKVYDVTKIHIAAAAAEAIR